MVYHNIVYGFCEKDVYKRQDTAGRPAFGRADQPSGYGIDPVAGGISDEL